MALERIQGFLQGRVRDFLARRGYVVRESPPFVAMLLSEELIAKIVTQPAMMRELNVERYQCLPRAVIIHPHDVDAPFTDAAIDDITRQIEDSARDAIGVHLPVIVLSPHYPGLDREIYVWYGILAPL